MEAEEAEGQTLKMKKPILICMSASLLIACQSWNKDNVSEKSDAFTTADRLGHKQIDAQTGYVIHAITVDNIEMKYALSQLGDTVKIWTQDQDFVTSEGFKIGTSWEELPPDLQKNHYALPGWGYFVPLQSGWSLGFCEGPSCTDKPLAATSKVAWIEKVRK
jgi:hypothetical protein